MSKRFLATIDGGIEKLREKRRELFEKKTDMHFCDCEFCDRQGDEVQLEKIDDKLKEIDDEIKVLERYKRDHAVA